MTKDQLSTLIRSTIYENDNNEIQADKHQYMLLTIIASIYNELHNVGTGFLGKVSPADQAPTPTTNGFYMFDSDGTVSYLANKQVKAGGYLTVEKAVSTYNYGYVESYADLTDDIDNGSSTIGASAKAVLNLKEYLITLITKQDDANTIKAKFDNLGNVINTFYLKVGDVKNNFTSTDTNKPLSALKGKELYDYVVSLQNKLDSSNVNTIINKSSGIAGLDSSGKLTEALLPYQYQKTSEKGQPNGYASLDGSGDVPDAQIPTNIERNTNKNTANGYAGLDSSGYIPISLIRSDLLEQLYSYGVKYDVTISSPTLTRTMNMDLHRSLPIQSKMRGCLLDDNGVVVEYIDDWSTTVKDGSKGQVMIEIPTHYVRFITDGNIREVRMSEIPIPGYRLIAKHYISAYEASVNRANNKLSSVVNIGVDYRGGNNNATWDGTYRTLLGRPATLLSRTNLRTYARNRNGAATSEWNLMVYSSYRDLFWLFALEYATLNSQLPLNPVKDANGFSQGGLGNGVTTLASTQWNNYNSYYPFVPCGHSDSLGAGSGEVAYNMIDDLGSTVAIVMVNRYRGVELPFGHIWKWTDGINIDVKSDADGGTSKIYTCENTDKYNDDGYDYYDMIGLEGRSEGYVRKITFGESGDISAAEVGGGSTTYFCDYHYASVSSSSLRGVLLGGNAYCGAAAGFVYSGSNYAPSGPYAHVGSRLCFIPQRTR